MNKRNITTKKLLIISQCFYPETFRINDLCQEWVHRGYDVTVLTGIPNYPQGKFYEGYGLCKKRREEWNGIHILRIPIIPRGHTSLGLLLNYLSFVLSGFLWKLTTSLQADLVFTYETSPMTQALVSVWYAKKRKIPHYLYVTDLWPENVEIVTGIRHPALIIPLQKMVDYIYRHSKKILTSSQSFISAIEKRGIARENLMFWPQYAEDFYRPISGTVISEIPDDGRFIAAFAGNLGYAQGLWVLPEAAAILKQKQLSARFVLIGDGRYKEELIARIRAADVGDYFLFIDRKSAESIPSYLSRADALLITLSKSEVFAMTIPAKTQSCMACGKPIIVCADGEVQWLIQQAHAGLVGDAEDARELAKNIEKMMAMDAHDLQQYGKNALLYSKTHFDKSKLLDQIDMVFFENS